MPSNLGYVRSTLLEGAPMPEDTRPHGQRKGLGLVVTKGYMHSQGGDLRFLGNSPSGAQFLLTLPASMREGET